jgi:hypothetical protein
MTVSVNGTTGITFNDASTQNTAATGFGFKNRIINGAMVIDQRNAGASVTPTNGQYSVDRFACNLSAASKYSAQQSSVAPAGFTNSLLITSLSSYSVGVNDYFLIRQSIEGLNCADLGWGTANAQTVTVSFWVRSSLTGTFGGALENSASNRCYPFSYTINSANTWEQKTLTIAGDTTGTWLTTNGIGIKVTFSLGMGSNLSGTAGAWVGSEKISATGATSVVGTNGATFYITGVMLEKGSTATNYDVRPYGTELALCQRYAFNASTTNQLNQIIGVGQAYSTTQALISVNVPVSMRVVPSLTYNTNTAIWNAAGSSIVISTLAISPSANNSTFRIEAVVVSAGLVAGNAAILQTGALAAGQFFLSAEL